MRSWLRSANADRLAAGAPIAISPQISGSSIHPAITTISPGFNSTKATSSGPQRSRKCSTTSRPNSGCQG